ncbi:MAG TPA: DUF1540 domain-containing protein [Terriglobales bacterium]|nr:DUF1540 domain-containing protein [Candidatus Acidoferrum sp.]HWQ51315.1 DUF1540 domain-containing protein [Terriglobales bacterium]
MSDINHGVACYVDSCKYHSNDHTCVLDSIDVGPRSSTMNAIGSPSGAAACESYEPR